MVIYIKPKNIPPQAVSWTFIVFDYSQYPYTYYGQYGIPVDAEMIVLSLPDLDPAKAAWTWNAIQADGGAFTGSWAFGTADDYYLYRWPFLDGEIYTLDMVTGVLSGKFGAVVNLFCNVSVVEAPADMDYWEVEGTVDGKQVSSGPLAPYAIMRLPTGQATLTFWAQKYAFDEQGQLVGTTTLARFQVTTTLSGDVVMNLTTGKLGGVTDGTVPPRPPSPTGRGINNAWLWAGAGVLLLLLVAQKKKSLVRGRA